MKEYHKIQSVFLRNLESRGKELLPGKFTLPEFEALQNLNWIWTEKIDGTNIRIAWDSEQVVLGGRTDNANLPALLVRTLQEKFTPEKMATIFNGPACLYGEGYGTKIQSCGSAYIPDRNDFILFDVRIGDLWLERHNVEDIAEKLGIQVVPIVGSGTLSQAIEFVRNGFYSKVSSSPLLAEGVITRPAIELRNRVGHRIITKIKHKDFLVSERSIPQV